jgi:hypothetical protein
LGYRERVSSSPIHDPVSALAESGAIGATAETFADIRETMAIPLVTSIWRVLAGVEGALSGTWEAAKPLIETGQADAALHRLTRDVSWPVPDRQLPGGAWQAELVEIRAVVGAYARSNGLSLLVLSALVTEPAGESTSMPVPPRPGAWPKLPQLPSRDEISDDTWTLIERVNRIGATPDQPAVATLWRHLARWPRLLSAIDDAFGPLQVDGSIADALTEARVVIRAEAARLAYLRSSSAVLPPAARRLVRPYVTHPGLVQRMVVIGHGLAGWLGDDPHPR